MALVFSPDVTRRVSIGADQQDWSLAAGPLRLGRASLSEQGLLPITGSLVIYGNSAAPESVDSEDNPARWRPGTPVQIELKDSGGNWVPHPMGSLFILEDPDPPQPGGIQITLSLGCWLAWANTFQFQDDRTGITLGTAEDCNVIAQRLLEAGEIPSGSIALSTWPHQLAYPAIPDQSAGFVGQAGEMAYANDFRQLYATAAGAVADVALSLTPTTPTITITLGVDDLPGFAPLRDPQSPVELVKVAGQGWPTNPFAGYSETQDTTDDASNYANGVFGSVIANRVITTVSYDATPPGISKTTRVQTFELEATVDLAPTSPTQLVEFTDETEVRTYDDTTLAVTQVTTTTRQRERSLLAEGNSLNSRLVRRITETYTYNEDQVATTTLTEEEAEYLYDPASTSPWDLRTTLAVTLTFTDIGGGNWRRRETRREARIRRDSAVDKFASNPWALSTSATTTESASGDTQPPATEYFQAATATEAHYEGETTWTHPGGATGRTRERLYTLPVAFSDTHCAEMASRHRDLLVGNAKARVLPLPLSDALLAAPPLFQVDVIHPNGTTYHYLADALSFAHETTSSAATAVGIYIGETP